MGVARGLRRRTEVPSISFYFGYISFIFLHTLMYAHARAHGHTYQTNNEIRIMIAETFRAKVVGLN
jgi:hypothetical protein